MGGVELPDDILRSEEDGAARVAPSAGQANTIAVGGDASAAAAVDETAVDEAPPKR